MSIFAGNSYIKSIQIGSDNIKEVYVGSKKIWPAYKLTVEFLGVNGGVIHVFVNNEEVEAFTNSGYVYINEGSEVLINVEWYGDGYLSSEQSYWKSFNKDSSFWVEGYDMYHSKVYVDLGYTESETGTFTLSYNYICEGYYSEENKSVEITETDSRGYYLIGEHFERTWAADGRVEVYTMIQSGSILQETFFVGSSDRAYWDEDEKCYVMVIKPEKMWG